MTDISTEMTADEQISVTVDKGVEIDTNMQLLYIKSGQKEIADYVENTAKPEITNYTNEYAKPIVTEIVNQTTKPLIDDYLNTTTKPQIDEYVADNVKPYADSAQDSAAKAKISEDNAKTSETNAEASKLAAASSAGVASAAAVTATEAKDYTAKVLTDENLKTVGQDLQSADSNIKTVATNIVNVNINAKNIDNINMLAPHTEAMDALAPDIMNVVTVAGIAEQTKNVSENMTAVVDVSNNKTNINNVAENITAVNNVSENMADVKNAVQSANDAKLWAVGTIAEKPEGSSKYWAEQAKNVVQTPDASETLKGIVRLATSDEVTTGTNDSAAITPLKFKQKIAQDLKNPSADKIPSTKAMSDESSRTMSIMDTKVNKSGDTMNGRLVNFNAIGPFTVRTSQYNNNISNDFFGSDLTIDSEDDINHIYFAGSNHTNNDIHARIVCNKNINGKQIYSEIYAGLKANGVAYSYAPQSNANNSIVTTISHGSNWIRLGNGIQICWGRVNVNGAITATNVKVNFPQPFSALPSILSCDNANAGTNASIRVGWESTVSFTIGTRAGESSTGLTNWIAIGYWY